MENCCSPSTPWRLTTAILGTLCLTLLVTSGVLAAQVSRWQQNFTQQQEILENLTCHQTLLQNQRHQLQEILQNLTQEKNSLQIQNTELLWSSQLKGAGDKCKICPKNWIQYGKACYDISSGIKSWSECKKYCSSLSSRLLKIDSKEELNVLKPVTYLACWMGSFYDEAKGSWQWEDGTTLSSDVFPGVRHYNGTLCATLHNGKVQARGCESLNLCVCEKESV